MLGVSSENDFALVGLKDFVGPHNSSADCRVNPIDSIATKNEHANDSKQPLFTLWLWLSANDMN